jgi:methionyl-tRNA formyltransferase
MTLNLSDSSLRLVFMGTPEFSVHALRALHGAGYSIVAVYSQPPKPMGRGYKMTSTPVHQYAESLGIPVFTPKTLKTPEAQEQFRALKPDLAIVAAYGLILPQAILETPTYGCLNIHGSILPRWRGAAPIQRAIMAGDSETGITIMKMDEGLDTGDMLTTATLPITNTMTAGSLTDELAPLGAELLLRTIPGYVDGSIVPQAQPPEGVTYAHKVSKEESRLDWRKSAWELDCQIRGLSPWPGSYFMVGEDVLKVLQAHSIDRPVPDEVASGEVLDDHLTIACGEMGTKRTALRIDTLQKSGGRGLSTEDFLRGYSLPKGTCLPCPDIK